MKLTNLQEKSVLILGLGREGLSTYQVLRNLFPKKLLIIADKNLLEEFPKSVQQKLKTDRQLKLNLGSNYLQGLEDYEVIIKTPGISPLLPEIQFILNANKSVLTSQTELFFENFKGKIIGITGTKGKSTTSSLIYHLLKTVGFNVKIGGNIGKPALELLGINRSTSAGGTIRRSHDSAQVTSTGGTGIGTESALVPWAILELSSHQLWDLKKSPHIAVFLNIYPEHLDYSDFTSYFKAKQNIVLWQKNDDYFVYNNSFPELESLAEKTGSYDLGFDGSGLAIEQQLEAVKTVAEILKIDTKDVEKAIKTFKPLAGRLERVGTYKGITFYDDALATIPQATLNSLKTFSGEIGVLFLGGFDRGQDFIPVIEEVKKQKVPLIILFPPVGEKILNILNTKYFLLNTQSKWFLVKSMKEAVQLVYKHCPRHTIALFSTGAPSFGLFKDYKHRSEQFRYWLKKLGKN